MSVPASQLCLVADDVKLGRNVRMRAFVNLYGCTIGDDVRIGTFVEIQKGASIGHHCKIQSHTFICEGVTIEDEVFVGHGVTFINDRFPRATNDEGLPKNESEWTCESTLVKRGASIGSGATVLCGVTIGERALVGAGSVVTKDVPPGAMVAGNPARVIRTIANGESETIHALEGRVSQVPDILAKNGEPHAQNGDATPGGSRPAYKSALPTGITGASPGGSSVAFESALRRPPSAIPTAVPFLNLRLHHESMRAELSAAIEEVIEASSFAGGAYVERFEHEFARFCGVKYASGVGNGTDALWFALLALGVGPGDEVITVPSTFMATAEAISFCGARPVFVDIDEETYTLDPAQLEQAITPRTKAIVPVHLFGQMADMDPILAVAHRHGLPVVEDACQAHGAEYKGRKAGAAGDIGCFSFYPGKNLGALGEAGAAVTDNAELKQKIDTLRDHGQAKKYHHSLVGWNGRMDGIQGAVLSVKLKRLAAGNELRRRHAQRYAKLLAGLDEIILPLTAPHRVHVFHLYAVRVPQRDDLIRTLAAQGIASAIHYPIPVHLQEAYRELGFSRGAFPVAERCADEFVSLPMFPELTDAQIEVVARSVRAWVENALVAA